MALIGNPHAPEDAAAEAEAAAALLEKNKEIFCKSPDKRGVCWHCTKKVNTYCSKCSTPSTTTRTYKKKRGQRLRGKQVDAGACSYTTGMVWVCKCCNAAGQHICEDLHRRRRPRGYDADDDASDSDDVSS